MKELLDNAQKLSVGDVSEVKDLIIQAKKKLEEGNTSNHELLRNTFQELQDFENALNELSDDDRAIFSAIICLIKELELPEGYDIDFQISETEKALESAKTNKRQNNIDEESSRLDKLQKLKELLNKTQANKKSSLVEKDEMIKPEVEIKFLIQELELPKGYDIDFQISETEKALESAKTNKRQNNIDEESLRLEKLQRLKELKSKSKILIKLKSISQQLEQKNKEKTEILSNLGLDESCNIDNEIAGTKFDLGSAITRSISSKINNETQRLQQLEHLKQLITICQDLQEAFTLLNQTEKLNKEIPDLMKILTLDNNVNIDEEIKLTNEEFERAIHLNLFSKIDDLKKRLQYLDNLNNLIKTVELSYDNYKRVIIHLKITQLETEIDLCENDSTRQQKVLKLKELKSKSKTLIEFHKISQQLEQKNKEKTEILSNLGLDESCNIDDEIAGTKFDLGSAITRSISSKINNETQRLQQLEHLKQLITICQDLQEAFTLLNQINKLDKETAAITKKLALDNTIDKEIEFTKADLERAMTSRLSNKITITEQHLTVLYKLKDSINLRQQLFDQYKALIREEKVTGLMISPRNEENEKSTVNSEEEIRSLILELELPEGYDIGFQIKETENALKTAKTDNRQKNIDEETLRLKNLQKLNELLSTTPDYKIKPMKNNHEENRKVIVEHEIEELTINTDDYTPVKEEKTSQAQHLQLSQSNSSTVTEVENNSAPKIVIERKNCCRIYSRDELNGIPECAQRTLLSLIIEAQNNMKIDEKSLEILLQQINEEGLINNSVIFESIMAAKVQINEKKLFMQSISRIMKEISPIDWNEVEFLVEKANEAGNKIKGQDIILLLGATGAGKSTTILYLAGQPLKGNNQHVTPDGPLKYSDLSHVITSDSAASETRYIHPVVIPLEGIVLGQFGSIIYCDAPGFEDTSGPEVDISNSIGIIEAIKETKSIKILALSNYEGMGERGQGLQKLAHIIGTMIKDDIEDRLLSVTYGFTKYPPGFGLAEISEKVYKIRRDVVEVDNILRNDKAFVAVLQDIMKKTRDERNAPCIINALDKNPGNLTQLLLKSTPIKNPEEAFTFSLSPSSLNSIQKHVDVLTQAISQACNNENYDLVHYYLTCFTKILNLLPSTLVVIEKFEKSCDYVANFMNKCFNTEKEMIIAALDKATGIEQNQIQRYTNKYYTFVKMKNLSPILKERIPTEEFISYLHEILRETTEGIKKKLEEEDENLKNYNSLFENSTITHLHNCELISNYIKEMIDEYNIIKNLLTDVLNIVITNAKSKIKDDSSMKFSMYLLILLNSENLMHRLQIDDTNIVQSLLSVLEKKVIFLVTSITQNYNSFQYDSSFSLVTNDFKIVHDIYDNKILQNILLQKSEKQSSLFIDVQYNNLLMAFDNYFKTLSEDTKTKLEKNDANAFQFAMRAENIMKILRDKIPQIYTRTDAVHRSLADHLRTYTENLKYDTEQFEYLQTIEPREIREIAKRLQKLKHASKWINKTLGYDSYTDTVTQMKSYAIKFAEKIVDQITNFEISLHARSDMEEYVKYMEKFDDLAPLEAIFPELIHSRNEAQNLFTNSIVTQLSNLDRLFNLNGEVLQKKIDERNDLETRYNQILKIDSALVNYNIMFSDREFSKEKALKKVKSLFEEEKGVIELEIQKLNDTIDEINKLFEKPPHVYFSEDALKKRKVKSEKAIHNSKETIKDFEKKLEETKEKYSSIMEELEKNELNDKQIAKLGEFESIENLKNKIDQLSKEIIELYNDDVECEVNEQQEILRFVEENDCETNLQQFKSRYISKQQTFKNRCDDDFIKIGNLLRMTDYILLDKNENAFKFSIIADKVSEARREQLHENYRGIIDSILANNFIQVQYYLVLIGNPIPEKEKKQIIFHLNLKLKKMKDFVLVSITQLATKIEFDFEAQQNTIRKISTKIKTINNCKNDEITKLLSSELELSDFTTQLETSLKNMFSEAIKKIKDEHINEKTFLVSEIALRNIEGFHTFFAEHMSNDTNIKIIGDIKQLQKSLNQDIENWKTSLKDFDKYPTNGIADLIHNFEKLAANNKRYEVFRIQAKDIINSTLQTEMDNIVKEKNYHQKVDLLRKFNTNIGFLPPELRDNYKSQIDQIGAAVSADFKIIENDIARFKNLTFSDFNKEIFQELKLKIKHYSEINEKAEQGLKGITEEIFIKMVEALEKVPSNSYNALIQALNIFDAYDEKFILDTTKINQTNKIMKNILNQYTSDIFYNTKGKDATALEILHKLIDAKDDYTKIKKIMWIEDYFSILKSYFGAKKKLVSDCNKIREKIELILQKHEFGLLQEIINFFNHNSALIAVINKIDLLNSKYKHQNDYFDTLTKLEKINSPILKKSLTPKVLKSKEVMPKYKESKWDNVPFSLSHYSALFQHLHNMLICRCTNFNLVKNSLHFYESECSDYFHNIFNNYQKLIQFESKISNLIVPEKKKVTTTIELKILGKEKVDEKISLMCKQEIKILKEKFPSLLTTPKEGKEKDCDGFRVIYYHLDLFGKIFTNFQSMIQHELQAIEQIVISHFDAKCASITKELCDSAIAKIIIDMKFFAINLGVYNSQISSMIDKILQKIRQYRGPSGIRQLSANLEICDLGCQLIQEHTALICEDWRKRREKMQEQDNIDKALENLDGTNLDKKVLRKRFDEFLRKYEQILRDSMSTRPDDQPKYIDTLCINTKNFVSKMAVGDISRWSSTIKDNIPELLAHIFGIWTILNSEEHNEARGIDVNNSFLLRPHVCQILSIFRMLGIGYSSSDSGVFRFVKEKIGFVNPIEGISNNLIEIGTGEGKSVVLAVASCIFALLGFDVNCSCYSEELSRRDKQQFFNLFRILQIQDKIHYGTFNQLCEDLLNKQCNIRETILNSLQNNKITIETFGSKYKFPKGTVLLIDEVDVFLSEKYYGGAYNPTVKWINDDIFNLLEDIWKTKPKYFKAVTSSDLFTKFVSNHSLFTKLIGEAIKDLVASVNSDIANPYRVIGDKIQYLDGESYTSTIFKGYETVWAYFKENEKGKITKESLRSNVGLLFNCGVFSFAEMPHDFKFITGVSGTLKTLASKEQEILKEIYHIQHMTYAPSVFKTGTRKIMAPNITNSLEEYFDAIESEISTALHNNRAVLVFFTDESKINAFYNECLEKNKKGIPIDSIQIVTERLSSSDRKLFIKRASTPRKVSLFTRTFGRGTDFMVNNQELITAGGILVVHCFYSEEASEEKQIQGRCARQGDPGTYKPVYLANDLDWLLGSNWEEEIKKIQSKSDPQSILNEKRDELYNAACESRGLGITQLAKYHTQSILFLRTLTQKRKIELNFLLQQNKGAEVLPDMCKTIVLVDGTSSMGSLLEACKNTVCTMFERANAVLKENKIPEDIFQLKFVVYRDYDCKEEILQASTWQSNPAMLRTYISQIKPKGGGDYEEAIEIGLKYCVEQHNLDGISQIILIADAPAKSKEAIANYRAEYGGEEYWFDKFGPETHYETELLKLRTANIPIHTFYLRKGAKKNLSEIATSEEHCVPLDINSDNGAITLTNLITERILSSAAKDEKQREQLLATYKTLYVN